MDIVTTDAEHIAAIVAAAQQELAFVVERIAIIDRTLAYAGFDAALALERDALEHSQRSLKERIDIWQRGGVQPGR